MVNINYLKLVFNIKKEKAEVSWAHGEERLPGKINIHRKYLGHNGDLKFILRQEIYL